MVKPLGGVPPPDPPSTVTRPEFPVKGTIVPLTSATSIPVGLPEKSISDSVIDAPMTSKQIWYILVPSGTVVPTARSSLNQLKVISPGAGLAILELCRLLRFKFCVEVNSRTVSS